MIISVLFDYVSIFYLICLLTQSGKYNIKNLIASGLKSPPKTDLTGKVCGYQRNTMMFRVLVVVVVIESFDI